MHKDTKIKNTNDNKTIKNILIQKINRIIH